MLVFRGVSLGLEPVSSQELVALWPEGLDGCVSNFAFRRESTSVLRGEFCGPQTPPKFNMEPEKKCLEKLEKQVPLGNHHFQVNHVKLRGLIHVGTVFSVRCPEKKQT